MFYPLDFCRTRLTADTTPAGQQRPFTGIASCLRQAWAQEGLRSWYKGMGLSLPGVVVYTSISFTAYDTLKVRVCGVSGRVCVEYQGWCVCVWCFSVVVYVCGVTECVRVHW